MISVAAFGVSLRSDDTLQLGSFSLSLCSCAPHYQYLFSDSPVAGRGFLRRYGRVQFVVYSRAPWLRRACCWFLCDLSSLGSCSSILSWSSEIGFWELWGSRNAKSLLSPNEAWCFQAPLSSRRSVGEAYATSCSFAPMVDCSPIPSCSLPRGTWGDCALPVFDWGLWVNGGFFPLVFIITDQSTVSGWYFWTLYFDGMMYCQ